MASIGDDSAAGRGPVAGGKTRGKDWPRGLSRGTARALHGPGGLAHARAVSNKRKGRGRNRLPRPFQAFSVLDIGVRVDNAAVLADGEVEVGTHLALRRAGGANTADDITGTDGLSLRHRHIRLQAAVLGCVAAAVLDDHGGPISSSLVTDSTVPSAAVLTAAPSSAWTSMPL